MSAFTILLTSTGFAGTEKVVYNVTESAGYPPVNGLIFDSAGNLYGSAELGGSTACANNQGGCGVVFALSPRADGSYVYSEIYKFTGGSDGFHPFTNLVLDSAGNLYGATYGSTDNSSNSPASPPTSYGTVFELSPTGGGPWSFTLLYTFSGGSGGSNPNTIAIDGSGNLYGTTLYGGSANDGIVYKLTPNNSGPWNLTLIHDFTGCQDSGLPTDLRLDQKGNIYVSALLGGGTACGQPGGAVLQFAPLAGGGWQLNPAHLFTFGSDGGYPHSLVPDSTGNIYGLCDNGGKNGDGLVFELSKSGGQWNERVLHNFDGQDGLTLQGLQLGTGGVLYGTAENNYEGRQFLNGIIFELTPKTGTKETILYQFTGHADGGSPAGPIVLDKAGNIYGGTLQGGSHTVGVIFEFTP